MLSTCFTRQIFSTDDSMPVIPQLQSCAPILFPMHSNP